MNENAVTQRPAKKSIADLIRHDMRDQFAMALPSICTPDRFIRVALTTINKNPKLGDCTQASLLGCLMDCASLGIEPDGRRAHIIPYGDKATLIIDYKGLIELARRSGEVSNWRGELVCEADGFSFKNGKVEHTIDYRKPRGPVFAVYSECLFKDGTIDFEVMTIDEVNAVRKRSRASSSGPWVTDYNEMAKKTVIRRHSKRLPLSAEFRDALEKDQDVIDIVPQGNVQVVQEESKARLADIIARDTAAEAPSEAPAIETTATETKVEPAPEKKAEPVKAEPPVELTLDTVMAELDKMAKIKGKFTRVAGGLGIDPVEWNKCGEDTLRKLHRAFNED